MMDELLVNMRGRGRPRFPTPINIFGKHVWVWRANMRKQLASKKLDEIQFVLWFYEKH